MEEEQGMRFLSLPPHGEQKSTIYSLAHPLWRAINKEAMAMRGYERWNSRKVLRGLKSIRAMEEHLQRWLDFNRAFDACWRD